MSEKKKKKVKIFFKIPFFIQFEEFEKFNINWIKKFNKNNDTQKEGNCAFLN